MRSRAAMSLVEVVVAAMILAVLALALFNMLGLGYAGTERLEEETLASNWGASLVEALVAVPYSQLPEVAADTPDRDAADLLAAAAAFRHPGAPTAPFERFVEVSEVSRDSGPWGPLKLVRVTVRWRELRARPARERSLVFQTLLGDDGEVGR